MARVSVKLPAGAVSAGGRTEVEVEAATVQEAIDKAIALEPSIRLRVYRDDGRMYAGVFVGGRNIKLAGGLEAELKDGDVLRIVPPISGG
ncbi:MAG: MoaD/ThiS family protein [Actinobacteria bacterium]|nr:MoaD/ThiS family protein [Actinomycetota bacterium]